MTVIVFGSIEHEVHGQSGACVECDGGLLDVDVVDLVAKMDELGG